MPEKLCVENTSRKGKAGGYASLGADGLVPTTQLPSSQGTGAPVNASYVTISVEAGLSNETIFSNALTQNPHTIGGTAHSGTLDGNQLPAMSVSKRGAVPAVGTATGAFLSSEGTWGVAGGGDMYKATYDPNADGTIALAQLDPLVCSEAEADSKISTHGTVTVNIHNFDATGYAFPQTHTIGGTAHSGTLSDALHGTRGASLHSDSHAQGHAISSADHSGTLTDAQHGARGAIASAHALTDLSGTLSDVQHGVRALVGAHALAHLSGTLAIGGHGDRSAEAGTLHGMAQLSGPPFSGLTKISVGTSIPSTPSIGDLWVDTT